MRADMAQRFRADRLDFGLTVQACAKLLRVSVRTVQNWESGTYRIPHAPYKLMRILRGGKYLGPEWRDYFVRGDTMTTPEGHNFRAGDLAWWSLLVRQAHEFQRIMRERRAEAAAGREAAGGSARSSAVPPGPVARSGALDSTPAPAVEAELPGRDAQQGAPSDRSTVGRCEQRTGRVSEAGIPADFNAQGVDFSRDSDESLFLTLPDRQQDSEERQQGVVA
jgi:transcriptional regulator with XRE-family HTH domain